MCEKCMGVRVCASIRVQQAACMHASTTAGKYVSMPAQLQEDCKHASIAAVRLSTCQHSCRTVLQHVSHDVSMPAQLQAACRHAISCWCDCTNTVRAALVIRSYNSLDSGCCCCYCAGMMPATALCSHMLLPGIRNGHRRHCKIGHVSACLCCHIRLCRWYPPGTRDSRFPLQTLPSPRRDQQTQLQPLQQHNSRRAVQTGSASL